MTLIELFLFFFKISSVTFGGGIVILGIVQLEVEKRGGIGEEKFADMVSLAASMPGPITVSISWLLGRHYHGLKGSLAAAAGSVLPPFIIVLLLSPLILKYSALPLVQGFFRGVLAGTGAIIASVIFENVKGTLKRSRWNLIPIIAVISMIGIFHLHPLFSMFFILVLQFAGERLVLRWAR